MNEKRIVEIYKQNEQVMKIIYLIGGGMMLRQQLIFIADKLLNIRDINMQIQLANLKKAGFIVSTKLFASCINKVIVMKKSGVARITGRHSRDCWVPSLSPRSKLYYTFRTELVIQKIDKISQILRGPFLIKKNNADRLYDWFEKNIGFITSEFIADKESAQTKEPTPFASILKRYDTFNFNNLLTNNFIITEVETTTESKIINIHFLNINRVTVNKFYELCHCVLHMLSRYTDIRFDCVEVTIDFFDSNELKIFKNKWNESKFHVFLMDKRLDFQVNNACSVLFNSLDLDNKYHLHRDL